jgi:multiple sugar transport system permease protein
MLMAFGTDESGADLRPAGGVVLGVGVAMGIGAFIVLCILFAWNDYLFAAIIGSGGAKTLPAATRELVQPQNIQWGQIMAAGVVTTLPMMFLGLVIRKYLVTGLTMGAVKE